jgi:formamidopyrimidine-DNA glycosylase
VELELVAAVTLQAQARRKATMAAVVVRTAPHTEVAAVAVEPVQQETTMQQRQAATAATERHRQFLARPLLTQAAVAAVAGL